MEKDIDISVLSVNGIEGFFNIKDKDIRSFSPLTLAYIGDAIYEVVIRTIIVEKGNAPVNKLHHKASSIVKATAQKEAMEIILPLLSSEEEAVFKRGRNAKSYTSAKNVSVIDYRIATGFEALMGFLYLTGKNERMLELIKAGAGSRL